MKRSNKDLEQVLVTKNHPSVHPPNKAAPYHFDQDYIHLRSHEPEWEKFVLKNASFVDRWLAEQDSTIVQLIPYVICCTSDGKILSYRRKGSEKRLEGAYSVGIGGHVNDTDRVYAINSSGEEDNRICWETILNGAAREVNEELSIRRPTALRRLNEIGLVYTPSVGKSEKQLESDPPVGAVHLGVIYTLEVSENIKPRIGQGVVDLQFIDHIPNNLDKYETWSSMILDAFDQIREDS